MGYNPAGVLRQTFYKKPNTRPPIVRFLYGVPRHLAYGGVPSRSLEEGAGGDALKGWRMGDKV